MATSGSRFTSLLAWCLAVAVLASSASFAQQGMAWAQVPPTAEPGIAHLSYPTATEPGLLRMPDGASFRLLADPVLPAQATAPAAGGQAAAGGAGGGGDQGGGPDAGTDPSKAKRRFNLFHEYYNIKGSGFDFNTTTMSVVLPILGGGGTLGVNVPFTYAELPQANPFGLGDAYARFIFMPTKSVWFKEAGLEWPFHRVIPVVGTDIYFPTADTTLRLDRVASRITTVSLGTRKYRLAPLAGFVWQVSERWTLIPIYFHDLSVAGDQTAPSINQGKLRVFVQYQDPSGWYFKPEFQLVTDYTDNNRCDFYVAPEVGKVLGGGTTFYVKPGYGFIETTNNRNWGIEAGVRTTF